MKEKLHAAIAAGNAPEGYIFADAEKAKEQWDEEGGHLLELTDGQETAYFVALDDTPISLDVSIKEVAPQEGESYDLHPSATKWTVLK